MPQLERRPIAHVTIEVFNDYTTHLTYLDLDPQTGCADSITHNEYPTPHQAQRAATAQLMQKAMPRHQAFQQTAAAAQQLDDEPPTRLANRRRKY